MTHNKKLRVPYALAVHDEKEKQRIIKVLDEHRTNMDRETREFEKKVAKLFGKKYGIMVNSGSSANLLALEILNIPRGSEVITPLLTFSTTVSPIIKLGLTPVFTDVKRGKYVVDEGQIERLITRKTKALFIPLLIGNIPNLQKLRSIANKYKLYLIEDSCDTLGAKYNGIPTGFYSDISTTSFFGSHIITAAGNGGMLLVDDPRLRDKAKVFRGWGRSSSILEETENVELRFRSKLDNIPYDAKFIFDEIGYNFLPNELSSAFGNVQLTKLNKFRVKRERNFNNLLRFFSGYKDFFILPIQDQKVETQWLAFPLTIKPTAPFTRLELVKYLENQNIQTRPIFTGNILRQPGFKNIKHKPLNQKFPVTDEVMERGFIIGCHHGLEEKHLKRIRQVFDSFLKKYS